MTAQQRIVRVRRNYNQWVANQTLEDYALRFTAKSARKWSSARVANTAIGAVSFLALEAIGGAIAINYGFINATAAILIVGALIFLTSLPIAYYASTYGVDIDLLTRGAGFGYIGSTITSLIYASFTFLFFAIEAAIMSLALEMCFGVPLFIGYVISSLVVIPLVTHGITLISRFQAWTQPFWLVLAPSAVRLHRRRRLRARLRNGRSFAAPPKPTGPTFNILLFGTASTVVFSLIAQIGEQVDFLRFLPPRDAERRWSWWAAYLSAGPGWIVPGVLKMLAGSFLAFLAIQHLVPADKAAEPTQMYLVAFQYVFSSPELALAFTGAFVIISQIKINVTNAYAGSIAWSNFFSRLTHSHPGRVVWLVFNVDDRADADGARHLQDARAHPRPLLDRRRGLGRRAGRRSHDQQAARLEPRRHRVQARASLRHQSGRRRRDAGRDRRRDRRHHRARSGRRCSRCRRFSRLPSPSSWRPPSPMSPRGASTSPARRGRTGAASTIVRCAICEHQFETEDMAHCPAYSGPICSLCCSLETRCRDCCKPHARISQQASSLLGKDAARLGDAAAQHRCRALSRRAAPVQRRDRRGPAAGLFPGLARQRNAQSEL